MYSVYWYRVLEGLAYLSCNCLWSLLCSLACMVEASHMTICYTIAVYMVYSFLTDKADETRIGTLTGLLVRGQPFSLPAL